MSVYGLSFLIKQIWLSNDRLNQIVKKAMSLETLESHFETTIKGTLIWIEHFEKMLMKNSSLWTHQMLYAMCDVLLQCINVWP